MANIFTKATKSNAYLRLAITGPSGSGKTYSALALASGIGESVAVLDTEHGSASLYADRFNFDTVSLSNFSPERYIEIIHAAQEQRYDVLVIDSLSHAWSGIGGLLEEVDKADTGNRNQFAKWGKITPRHNRLIESILSARLHVIATMRSKTAWAMEQQGGKQVPVKVGLDPVQRPGVEYEFGIVAAMDAEHTMTIEKTRISALDGLAWQEPGAEIGHFIASALNDGATSSTQEQNNNLPSPFYPEDPEGVFGDHQAAHDQEAAIETELANRSFDNLDPLLSFNERPEPPSERQCAFLRDLLEQSGLSELEIHREIESIATKDEMSERLRMRRDALKNTQPRPKGNLKWFWTQARAVFNETGQTEDNLRDWMKDKGIESTRDMEREQMDEALAWLKNNKENQDDEESAAEPSPEMPEETRPRATESRYEAVDTEALDTAHQKLSESKTSVAGGPEWVVIRKRIKSAINEGLKLSRDEVSGIVLECGGGHTPLNEITSCECLRKIESKLNEMASEKDQLA